jgi:hypothetical protein
MSKSDHIQFEAQKGADCEWEVVAYCPGAIEHIPGFKSEDSAKQWIASNRSLDWARRWGMRHD